MSRHGYSFFRRVLRSRLWEDAFCSDEYRDVIEIDPDAPAGFIGPEDRKRIWSRFGACREAVYWELENPLYVDLEIRFDDRFCMSLWRYMR